MLLTLVNACGRVIGGGLIPDGGAGLYLGCCILTAIKEEEYISKKKNYFTS